LRKDFVLPRRQTKPQPQRTQSKTVQSVVSPRRFSAERSGPHRVSGYTRDASGLKALSMTPENNVEDDQKITFNMTSEKSAPVEYL
jgi:hypothetical protein